MRDISCFQMNDAICFIGSVREWVSTDIQMTDSSLSLKLEAPDQEFREGSDTVLKLTTCRTRITG